MVLYCIRWLVMVYELGGGCPTIDVSGHWNYRRRDPLWGVVYRTSFLVTFMQARCSARSRMDLATAEESLPR